MDRLTSHSITMPENDFHTSQNSKSSVVTRPPPATCKSPAQELHGAAGKEPTKMDWHKVFTCFLQYTLPETDIAPENRPMKLVFQPSFFRCYVSFREGNSPCLGIAIF